MGSETFPYPVFEALSSNNGRFLDDVSVVGFIVKCSVSGRVVGCNTVCLNAGLEVLKLNGLFVGKTDRLDATGFRLVLGTVGLENTDFVLVSMVDLITGILIVVGPGCGATSLLLLYVLLLGNGTSFN